MTENPTTAPTGVAMPVATDKAVQVPRATVKGLRRPRGRCGNPKCPKPGRYFTRTRAGQRYCSDKCRYVAWDDAHPRAGMPKGAA